MSTTLREGSQRVQPISASILTHREGPADARCRRTTWPILDAQVTNPRPFSSLASDIIPCVLVVGHCGDHVTVSQRCDAHTSSSWTTRKEEGPSVRSRGVMRRGVSPDPALPSARRGTPAQVRSQAGVGVGARP